MNELRVSHNGPVLNYDGEWLQNEEGGHNTFSGTFKVSGADFWQNRGFNDKSVKTSKIVHLDLLSKIGYGPIA